MFDWYRRKHPKMVEGVVICPLCMKEGKGAIQGYNISSIPTVLDPDPRKLLDAVKNSQRFVGFMLCQMHTVLQTKRVILRQTRCRVCGRLMAENLECPPLPEDFAKEALKMTETVVDWGLCEADGQIVSGTVSRRATTKEMGLR